MNYKFFGTASLYVLGVLIVISLINKTWDLFFQLLFVFILAAVAFWIMYLYRNNFTRLEHWATHHNLKFNKSSSQTMRFERFNANKNKNFFKSRSVKENFDTAPSIEGIFNGRQFWLFGLIGIYPFNKIPDPDNKRDGRQKFTGWCMELQTHKIPVSLIVRRNYLGGKDEVDTESNAFEKLYHVDVYEGYGTLQLLDPMMIQLITDSGIAAFEFSDSSVVLYYTLHKLTRDQLDNMLKVGLKIAEQIDRNFPMGKYEKK